MYICIINLAHAQCMHLLSTCFSTTKLVFIESRRIIKRKCFDLMRIFSWCQTWDQKKKKINSFCLYQYDNPTKETSVSLPTSLNERASDTTNKMASPSFIDKGSSVDQSTDDNLHNCSKMWRRRCELSPDRWRKLKKKSNASICYTRRENTESNFSTAGTCLRMTQKSWTITR